MLGMHEFVLGVSAKLWGPTSLSQIRAVHVAMALANADSQPVTLEMWLVSLLRHGAFGNLRAVACLRGSTAEARVGATLRAARRGLARLGVVPE